MQLTFVYVPAILSCVYAISSGTDQLPSSCFYRQILRITFKAPRVLVALKGFAIVRNTRQAKHGSTTTGQAKHVGIEPSLWKTFIVFRESRRDMGHFTGANTLYFTLMTRFLLLTFYFTLSLHFTPGLQSAVCVLHSPGSNWASDFKSAEHDYPWIVRREVLFPINCASNKIRESQRLKKDSQNRRKTSE